LALIPWLGFKAGELIDRASYLCDQLARDASQLVSTFERTAKEGRGMIREGRRAIDKGLFGQFVGALKEFLVPHPQRRARDRKDAK